MTFASPPPGEPGVRRVPSPLVRGPTVETGRGDVTGLPPGMRGAVPGLGAFPFSIFGNGFAPGFFPAAGVPPFRPALPSWYPVRHPSRALLLMTPFRRRMRPVNRPPRPARTGPLFGPVFGDPFAPFGAPGREPFEPSVFGTAPPPATEVLRGPNSRCRALPAA